MDEFLRNVDLGFFHVLDWGAYDHILFLGAMVCAYTFFEIKKVIWLVTAFTVGHTVALVLASYDVVNVNMAWVEFLIPVTIIFTAIINLFSPKKINKGKNILLILSTLAFGIVHGLGFSSFFEMIQGGAHGKFLTLIEFALGIEAAQIVVVLVVLIFAFLFQNIFGRSKRDWVLVLSAIIIGMVLPILKENFEALF
jgi:hypothetical protein